MNGTDKKKKKLFVMDKAYKSYCFNNAEQLPAEYAMNNKEWMLYAEFNQSKTVFASKHNSCFAASGQLHN